MDWFDDWALTLAVFIPLVGMAIVMLVPRAQETAVKVVALITSLATLAVGIGILSDFDYDNTAKMQFQVNKDCLLYTSPSPRDGLLSRMPSSA